MLDLWSVGQQHSTTEPGYGVFLANASLSSTNFVYFAGTSYVLLSDLPHTYAVVLIDLCNDLFRTSHCMMIEKVITNV